MPKSAAAVTLFVFLTACGTVNAVDPPPERIPIEELRLFTNAYMTIKQNYVDPVDDRTLIQECVKGMTGGIDAHSEYLDAADFQELRASVDRPIAATGLELTARDGLARVVTAIEDTPAARAGLRSGDVIVRLDRTDTAGMRLSHLVRMLRGEPGSKVDITVLRQGETQARVFSVTREFIELRSVKQRMLKNGVGYVRITTFQGQTFDRLKDSIAALVKEADGPLKGLVLDLRDNPGGVLNAAVAVGDAFLTDGNITYTEGRTADAKLRFMTTPGDILNGAPMVVLVNQGSAAGAEIVAGALQDHQRATLVGTRTFGRASIQTIIPLPEGGVLKLTSARWYTPNGRMIDGAGIVPEILVADGTSRESDPVLRRALQILRAL